MIEKKYELTDEIRYVCGTTIHRIRSLRDFAGVKIGDIGGWIESERNLSQEGDCWIYNEACAVNKSYVSGNASVSNNSVITDNATVCENARIVGMSLIIDNSCVSGNALVYDGVILNSSHISGNSAIIDFSLIKIKNTSDVLTIGPIGSEDDYITFIKDENNNILVNNGLYSGTIDEFQDAIERNHGNDKYNDEYMFSIKMAKSRLREK